MEVLLNKLIQKTEDSELSQEKWVKSILISTNFPCLSKGTKIAKVGFIEQPKGTQRSPDFFIFWNYRKFSLECKSSKKEVIFLNDGWFEKDTIYLIWFSYKKIKQTILARGIDLFTEEEDAIIQEQRRIRANLNRVTNNSLSLKIYNRAANRYDCRNFIQKSNELFLNTITFVSDSVDSGDEDEV